MKYCTFALLGPALLTVVFSTITSPVLADDKPALSALTWMDKAYLDRQRALIEDITKFEYGAPLRRNASDLRSLSRIIEGQLVNQTETKQQQALGVALGDIFTTELKMHWQVYDDADGKSLAVCMPKTTHCLFPVTMISKRMRLGAKPNVNKLFERGKDLMKPYVPRVPYSPK